MPSKKAASRIERRRSARADANLSMRVEGQPADGELTKIETESRNISASGVYCTSPHYLAPLSKVALTIILPAAGPIAGAAPPPRRLLKCDGIVVRCAPSTGRRPQLYELACSFVGLDPRHRDVIDEFVSWRNLESLTQEAVGRPRATKPRPRAAAGRRAASGKRATAASRSATGSRATKKKPARVRARSR